MKTEVELGAHLAAVLSFLDTSGRRLLFLDQAKSLADRAAALIDRIKEADDRIVIGLVGGTGVGKSTLINALAGREISARTDLRPTTDRVVLYRHQDNDYSLSADEDVHLHDSPALARISLVDFPDFDSLEPAHRQALAQHFPRLDLLLWVVDPVKYADQALFHWLSLAPQARVNSLFIFNKTDEYERRYGSEAASVVAETSRDLAAKLEKYAGLPEADILPLSALSALEGNDGLGLDGFNNLQARLEALSDKKKRLSIKSQNLTAMARGLMVDFQKAANLETARAGLEKLKGTIDQGEAELKALANSEARRLPAVLSRPWRAGLTAAARGRAPWPLDFFIFIWDSLVRLVTRAKNDTEEPPALPRPDLTPLVKRLETIRAEMAESWGLNETAPGQALAATLAKTPTPENTTTRAADALAEAGLKKAQSIDRRFRWRIRHHLLPLLVLAYPFLPMAAAWLGPLIFGESASAPAVSLSMGWKDLLPLVEIIAGLYVIETLYFAYRLNRAAGKALLELTAAWEGKLGSLLDSDLLAPARDYGQKLGREITTAENLITRPLPEDD